MQERSTCASSPCLTEGSSDGDYDDSLDPDVAFPVKSKRLPSFEEAVDILDAMPEGRFQAQAPNRHENGEMWPVCFSEQLIRAL